MQKFKENQKVLVDCWDYKTKKIIQHSGKVIATVTALDREFRVNLILDNGTQINEAAPECVHLNQ